MTRFNEKVLMFESCGDSPLVHVSRITDVEIARGEEGDEILLEVIPEDGYPYTQSVKFGERLALPLALGKVRASRARGEGPITVILFQE